MGITPTPPHTPCPPDPRRQVIRVHKATLSATRAFWKLALHHELPFGQLTAAMADIKAAGARAAKSYEALLERYPQDVKLLRSYARWGVGGVCACLSDDDAPCMNLLHDLRCACFMPACCLSVCALPAPARHVLQHLGQKVDADTCQTTSIVLPPLPFTSASPSPTLHPVLQVLGGGPERPLVRQQVPQQR
jgi:hypothetical protein